MRFSAAVHVGLVCFLQNRTAGHPGGFITDRQTRVEADWCEVGLMLPERGHLTFLSLWFTTPNQRWQAGQEWDLHLLQQAARCWVGYAVLNTPAPIGKPLHSEESVTTEEKLD